MTAPGVVPPPSPGWWVKRNRLVFPSPALLTLTGSAPILFQSLRPTGASLALTGSAPTISVAPAALAFQSIGGGDTQSASATGISASWSHTATGANRYVLVGVAVSFTTGTSADVTAFTRAATYGGTSMTSLDVVEMGGLDPGGAGGGWVELFGLASPATGAQTVVASMGPQGTSRSTTITANSVSYVNVTSVGSVFDSFSSISSLSLTVSSATNHRAFVVFGARNTLSAFDQTQRYINNPGALASNLILGDAPGAASVSFNATQASALRSGCVGVDLS